MLQKLPQKTLPYISLTLTISLLLIISLSSTSPPHVPPRDPHPTPPHPSISFLLTGTSGDKSSLLRLLLSVYHPNNLYLLHLDRFAPQPDRDYLANTLLSFPVFRAANNVHVVGHPDFGYVKGSSPVSAFLRGASILLRLSKNWDWFVYLNANDYPLITPDDLLHIFSYLPKDLNFVNHTSYIGWRESRRLKPIIVDPGLYLSEKTGMFYATQKRDLPSAFQMFSGSPTSVLNRKFIEHCILGSDNLPRTLLMYLANTQSSILSYVPTVLCNSAEFKDTAVNHNLLYASYHSPLKEDPRPLNMSDFNDMLQSGSAFATKFHPNDPILDRIDLEILGRDPGKIVPGGWCLGESNNKCDVWGDANILRPGSGSKRLEKCLVDLLSNGAYQNQQCRTQ